MKHDWRIDVDRETCRGCGTTPMSAAMRGQVECPAVKTYDPRTQGLLDKVGEFRRALDSLESNLRENGCEGPGTRSDCHYRLTRDQEAEMLLEKAGEAGPYHYFFARHRGGAYPRANPS